MLQPCVAKFDAHVHMALRGEFHRVGEQVFQDLLQPLRIGRQRARQIGGELHVEGQVLALGDMPEVAVDIIPQAEERDFLRFHGNGAGLDLGEIENVIDEVQEVGAGGVDIAGEIDLLRQPGCPPRYPRVAG